MCCALVRRGYFRVNSHIPGDVTADAFLKRLHRHQHELLRVLDRPDIPLHTNGSEIDIRTFVTKHKISDGTVATQAEMLAMSCLA